MAVGVLLGAVLQHLVHDRELWRIAVPYPEIAILLAGMVTVAVLAAAWPARRAGRTDILAAITTGRSK